MKNRLIIALLLFLTTTYAYPNQEIKVKYSCYQQTASLPKTQLPNESFSTCTLSNVDAIEKQFDRNLTISSLILGLAATLLGGGLFFTLIQVYNYKKGIKKQLEEVEEYIKEKNTLLDNKIKHAELEIDQMTRIFKIRMLLDNKAINEDTTFFENMSQLAQHPTAEMINISERVKNEYKGKFQQNIHDYADLILNSLKK